MKEGEYNNVKKKDIYKIKKERTASLQEKKKKKVK